MTHRMFAELSLVAGFDSSDVAPVYFLLLHPHIGSAFEILRPVAEPVIPSRPKREEAVKVNLRLHLFLRAAFYSSSVHPSINPSVSLSKASPPPHSFPPLQRSLCAGGGVWYESQIPGQAFMR